MVGVQNFFISLIVPISLFCIIETNGFWPKLQLQKNSAENPFRLGFSNQMSPFVNFTFLDEGLDSPQSTPTLIRKSGFPVEVHHVVTEDGYVLELHRIPHGKSKNSSTAWRKTAVLILHGYACTSIHWILNTEQAVLPYRLAEDGYDVWLGNFRGNRYSNRHLKFENNDTRFWNFSWHEMGLFDVPAMIDYVLEETKQSQLMYAAHSMGTTAFYVCMSIRTEYNAKIKGMFALAPVAYFKNIRNPAKLITPYVISDKLSLDAISHGELVPPHLLDSLRIFGSVLCAPRSKTAGLCDQFLHHIAGFNPVQLNKTWVPLLFRNYPDSSSTRTLLHFLQLVKSGKFCQYDYGVLENFRIYSRLKPPSYSLSKVTAPVAIYWSQDDWLATPEDVELLRAQLPNVFAFYKVESPTFSHLDFLCARDAGTLLYDKVLQSMATI